MTNTNDIQQARDVLAKWRNGSAPGPWVVDDDEEAKDIWAADDLSVAASSVHEVNVPLIVGTAGNPDLLEAIDGLLTIAADWAAADGIESVPRWMYRIAAAIIAADERMSA